MDNHEQSGNASGDGDGTQCAAQGSNHIDAADAKAQLTPRVINRRQAVRAAASSP